MQRVHAIPLHAADQFAGTELSRSATACDPAGKIPISGIGGIS